MSTIKQSIFGLICFLGIISPGRYYADGYSSNIVLIIMVITIGVIYFKYKWAIGYFPSMDFWQALLWCYAFSIFVLYLLALDISLNKDIPISDTFSFYFHSNTSTFVSAFITPIASIIISLYVFYWLFRELRDKNEMLLSKDIKQSIEKDDGYDLNHEAEMPSPKKFNPLDFISYDENSRMHLKTNRVIDYAFDLHSTHPDLSVRSILTLHRNDFEEIQNIMPDDVALEFELSIANALRKLKAA